MGLLHSADDDAFAQGHTEAGLAMRVKWVKKLQAELKRLKAAHPEEAEKIDKVLEETKEWL